MCPVLAELPSGLNRTIESHPFKLASLFSWVHRSLKAGCRDHKSKAHPVRLWSWSFPARFPFKQMTPLLLEEKRERNLHVRE